MKLTLNADSEKIIAQQIETGKFATPEEVVSAALQTLIQDDFAPGEWDALLEEGEASGPPLDGEEVLAELRALRIARQKGNAG